MNPSQESLSSKEGGNPSGFQKDDLNKNKMLQEHEKILKNHEKLLNIHEQQLKHDYLLKNHEKRIEEIGRKHNCFPNKKAPSKKDDA